MACLYQWLRHCYFVYPHLYSRSTSILTPSLFCAAIYQSIDAPTNPYNLSINTRSFGGGYHFALDEFWFPQWPTATIYRYDRSGNLVNFFTAATAQTSILQLFADPLGGGYYTANANLNTITKLGPFPQNVKQWTFQLGAPAGGVSADSNYVYAIGVTGARVSVLDRSNGALVRNITLSGSNDSFTGLSGGFLVALGKIYRGDSSSNQRIYRYDLATGVYDGVSFTVAEPVRVLTFDGRDLCISGGFTTLYCYRIVSQDIYFCMMMLVL